jgi:membrane protein YdbS with pleckstrin-like domain
MTVLFEDSPKKETPREKPQAVKRQVTPSVRTPFSAYAVKPADVHFETQEAGETVELFLRQHPIINVPWVAVAVLMVIAPTVIFPFVATFAKASLAIPIPYIIVFTAFWYLATFGIAFSNFLHWFFNIYIVTNERIVDIDFKHLLYKHFAIAELDKIQDLSYVEKGLLSTVFDFGNVYVQTAGEIPNVEFESVPHPEKVVEEIRGLTEQAGSGDSL